MWNEGLEEIAKEYGDHGKKPQNADNYIYLEKEKWVLLELQIGPKGVEHVYLF